MLPSLNYAKARELLTDMEFRILKLAFEQKGLIKTGDLAQVNPEWGKPACIFRPIMNTDSGST